MLKKTFVLAGIFLFFASSLRAEGEPAISFWPDDRVLVVAPHPDDESLGLGGILQKINQAHASVKIVYLTNGESNELSSLFYQKRPMLLKSDFIKSGMTRKNEAIAAMAALGIGAKNLIFLGYPDGGTLNIWLKYWGRSKPFRSFFTRINEVPYPDSFSNGHPYKGDEIVRDFERILLAETPTHIFVTAPFDKNRDHQAAFLYLRTALFNVSSQLPVEPKIHFYLIHAKNWPSPVKNMPDAPLGIPTHIDWNQEVQWWSQPLTRQEVEGKESSIRQYKSQMAYKKKFLLSFARSNEIFFEYPSEVLEHEPEAAKEKAVEMVGEGLRPGNVQYRIFGQELWIGIPLPNAPDEMGVVTSYVFGHRRDFLFSDGPKFSFRLFGNKLFTQKSFRAFHDPGILYKLDKSRLFIRMPLKLLKNPDWLFVSTRSTKEGQSLDFGSWKALEVVPDEASET